MSESAPALPDLRLACTECGTELSESMLLCPRCHRLIHAVELARLASDAGEALERGGRADARDSWRKALSLLPPGSQQFESVSKTSGGAESRGRGGGTRGDRPEWVTRTLRARIAQTDRARNAYQGHRGWGSWGGVLLVEVQFVVAFLLTKGKLLLLGLTKASTLFSMVLSLGVYWALFGWVFGAGLIGSIYVHEMGHVAALRRIGIRATAPMFIPGLGAMVRLKESPASAREDARVGLAGPIWGLAAALLTYAAYGLTGWASLAAIARVAAWINLFNLIPVWQLDGSRGFRALTRLQRGLVTAVMAAMWVGDSGGNVRALVPRRWLPIVRQGERHRAGHPRISRVRRSARRAGSPVQPATTGHAASRILIDSSGPTSDWSPSATPRHSPCRSEQSDRVLRSGSCRSVEW